MDTQRTRVPLGFQVIRWSLGCFLAGAVIYILYASSLATARNEGQATTATGISISKTQDMKFGTFIRMNSGGTATINVDGMRAVSGSTVAMGTNHGIYCQAQFAIEKLTGGDCPHDSDDDGDNDHDGDHDDNDHGDNGKKGGRNSISSMHGWGVDDKDDTDHDDKDDKDDGGSHCTCEFSCDNVGITLPTSVTLSNGNGGTMTVNNFTKRLNTAQTLLDVGASLNIQANQPGGTYSGTFQVTAICE